MTTVTDPLLRSLSDAYLQVGVWVGAMLVAIAFVQRRTGGRFSSLLGRRWWGPLVGALLGVSPGCGGAIVVMPIYAAGAASFGTVVATLVATMGDSSFVLLAARPVVALALHATLFTVGVIAGLAVDALGIAPRSRPVVPTPDGGAVSTVGAATAKTGLLGRPSVLERWPPLVLFWGLIGIGLGLSVAFTFNLTTPERLAVRVGWDPALLIGVSGTVLAVLMTVTVRAAASVFGAHDHHRSIGHDQNATTWESLMTAAHETAFVTTWVAVAFVAYEATVAVTGLDFGQLAGRGLLPVVAGAAIGLIPGCGPQILWTSLYIDGAVGIPALLANAISQDGDALFPLLARDRRAAILAATVTTVPALVVGTLAWIALG